MARIHKDLEFHVDRPDGTTFITGDFAKATEMAVALAASRGETVNIDTVAWSRAAAKAYMGDDGAEMYDEDPDASVFYRIAVRADGRGRVR